MRASRFVDRDGNVVNERGFLIDESTGDIRPKYTYEVVFKEFNLIGVDGYPNVELPLPLRFERFNFNPHECMGNFDYDDNDKPKILVDRHGNRIDKNLRKVNKSGWLIDKEENIIVDHESISKYKGFNVDPLICTTTCSIKPDLEKISLLVSKSNCPLFCRVVL